MGRAKAGNWATFGGASPAAGFRFLIEATPSIETVVNQNGTLNTAGAVYLHIQCFLQIISAGAMTRVELYSVDWQLRRVL